MLVQLFGLDGQRCASYGQISVALDILCGKVTARGGLDYVKEVFRFLDWTEALEREIVGLGSILICSYMRSVVARGNSVPVKVRCALNWFENHSSTPIGSLGVDIRDCVNGLSPAHGGSNTVAETKHQAPALSVDAIVFIEHLVCSAHTLPLRIFAGIVCLCTHGVKRWADAQHLSRLEESKDALLPTTYRSKRKDRPLRWAALKTGFSAVAEADWTVAFLQALAEAELPKQDFLVLRPSSDFQSFTDHPATRADANQALDALLVLGGLGPEMATVYTMHSCRHVYPTLAFQLMFPPAAVTLMGHWSFSTDRMATVYDEHRTSTELAYKANICGNVKLGWRPVEEGCVPDPPLVPLTVGGHPVVPAITPSTASSSKPAPTMVTEAICDEIIEQHRET